MFYMFYEDKKLISIVIPCYCEEDALPAFWEEINKTSQNISQADFEFLFVDDGSNDNTVNILRKLAHEDKRVRYISFSRNFGKEAAMYAGLKNAKGDYIAIMDADLQDPPSLLPQMLYTLENDGFDCVATRRVTRKGEPVIRSFFARVFYKLINKIENLFDKILDSKYRVAIITTEQWNNEKNMYIEKKNQGGKEEA